MSTNTSQTLGLHLWEPDDQVLRTEFNENWQKIDTEAADIREDVAAITADLGAAGKNARIAWGTYTGTGTFGEANKRTLDVGFYPVLALVGDPQDVANTAWPSIFLRGGGVAQPDWSVNMRQTMTVQWTDTAFSWYVTNDTTAYTGYAMNNASGRTYYYVVIGYDKGAE